MVFTSIVQLVRSRGPDEYWRKRKIFKLAAHYIGRRRNCYSIAIRSVHRALQYVTKGRRLKKQDMRELWQLRTNAGAQEHGIDVSILRDGLTRSNILLNFKTLSDLAIWEPRTFKSLSDIACTRVKMEPTKKTQNLPTPQCVIPTGLIK